MISLGKTAARLVLLGLVTAGLAACVEEPTGPEPTIVADAGPAISPGFACNEQVEGWVTVRGEDFAPLVVDSLEDPSVEPPSVVLTRVASIEGEADDGVFSVEIKARETDEAPRIKWISAEEVAFYVAPDQGLMPGAYDVTVVNANGARATQEGGFGVLPRPRLTEIAPELTCVAQQARQVTLTGDFFLVTEEASAEVEIDGAVYPVDEATDCRRLAPAFGGAEVCRQVTFTAPQDVLGDGRYPVVVLNPDPAACESLPVEDEVELEITGPPVVDAVSPEPICAEQIGYQQMRVSGQNFIKWGADGLLPEVEVGDQVYLADDAAGCQAIDTLRFDEAERCTELVFSIPAGDQFDQLEAGVRFAEVGVSVRNPEPVGCTSEGELDLTLVPRPSVFDATPEPTCTADQRRTIEVSGFGFLTVDGVLPTVDLGGELLQATSASDCTPVEGVAEATESCDTLLVEAPEGSLVEDDNLSVVVTNPETAACASTDDVTFYNAGRPSVEAVTPQPICTADAESRMVVTGANFLEINGQLPVVTVGVQDFQAVSAAGCVPAPLQDDGAQPETSICDQLEFVIGQADVDPGQYEVVVTNPPQADCASSEAQTLTVLPPPTLSGVVEQIACVAQGEASFTVSGDDFLIIDGEQPRVDVGGQVYEGVVDPASCGAEQDIGGSLVRVCSALDFAVPQADLAAGVYDVLVINPGSAACVSSNSLTLTIEDVPVVNSVAPGSLCDDGSTQTFTVEGAGFLTVDGTTPTVTVAGVDYASVVDPASCAAVSSVTERVVQRCDRLEVDVPTTELVLGSNGVVVTNPDPVGCASTDAAGAFLTAQPTVTRIDTSPAAAQVTSYTCNVDSRAEVAVEGDNFIRRNGSLPPVTVGATLVTPTSAEGCTPLAVGLESCTRLLLEVPAGTLTTGTLDVVVGAPGGTCLSQEQIALESVDAPVVASVNPALFCDVGSDTTLTVTGQEIFRVNGALPTVDINGASLTAGAAGGCVAVAGAAGLERCTSVDVTVPASTLGPADYTVTLSNPAPVGCSAAGAEPLVVAGPPQVASAQPAQVCDDGTFGGDITLSGANFLKIDGALPTVTVNGAAATVSALSNCTAVANASYTIESCTSAEIVVPVSQRDVDMQIALVNPAPADCGASTIDVPLATPPRVDSVTPLRICDQGGTFQITGEGFEANLQVELAGQQATTVVVNALGTSATVTFNAPPAAGTYDLTATNPTTTCSDTFDQQVRVVSGPSVFFVDPPVVYNGVNTQVTVFLSGLFGGSVSDVALVDAAGVQTPLSFNYDPTRPNQVQAIIPEDVLSAGVTQADFAIRVTDDVSCTGEGANLVSVTDLLSVGVKSITPPFGNSSEPTAVTIAAEASAVSGQDEFTATPRAYLNPVNPSPNTVAIELRSVQYLNSLELNALVQSEQLPLGGYDLIVVNPDGGVGLLPDAFEVVQEPAPVVDSASPGSWSNQESALVVTLEGSNFRAPTTAEVRCDTDGDGVSDLVSAMAVDAANSTSTTLLATVDVTPFPDGSVCLVRVTNTDNATYGDYAPVTVTNPSGNFVDFVVGPALNTARRDAAMASGQPTREAGFIYAIGGDDGDPANAFNTVEAAALDAFGNPGAWFELEGRHGLPAGRTLAEAVRIEDFIYLVGGDDGQGAVDTVWRANVLDPLDVPSITNVELDLKPEGNTGIAPGTYYYRVAAILDGGEAHNPGGETLTSEAQAVSIPLPTLEVTLAWPSFAGAVEYRVYRSEGPDLPFGSEVLLATVPANSSGGPVTYTDNGADSPQSGVGPLPLGSLGKWHPVATLATARHSHGVTAVRDPDLGDESTYYLYAVGGDDGTNKLDDYELFEVQVNGPRDSVVAADVANPIGDVVLGVPRSQLPVVAATPETASILPEATAGSPAEIYLYAMGGLDAAGSSVSLNEAALVGSDGRLGPWGAIKSKGSRAGHASTVANNRLLVAGGANAAPSTSADKGLLCGTGSGGGGTCTLPELDRWSSLSNVNMQARYLMGYVSYNGFIYLAGGLTPSGVTNSVDYSLLGGTP